MSWYLTVRSDARYSRLTPAGPLVEYLRTLPELVQVGPQQFRNAPGSPWVALGFAKADATGNYAIGDEIPPIVNVVELVCGEGDAQEYESLARRVGAFLRWEVVEERGERTVRPAE